MNNEIKGILECMSKVIFHEQGMALNTEECKTLLDYITNLQEENERLNNIINELEKYIEGKDVYKMLEIKLKELKENK